MSESEQELAAAEAAMTELIRSGLTTIPLLERAGKARRRVEDARRAVTRERGY